MREPDFSLFPYDKSLFKQETIAFIRSLLTYSPPLTHTYLGMPHPRHDHRATRGVQEGEPTQDGSLGLVADEWASLL